MLRSTNYAINYYNDKIKPEKYIKNQVIKKKGTYELSYKQLKK